MYFSFTTINNITNMDSEQTIIKNNDNENLIPYFSVNLNDINKNEINKININSDYKRINLLFVLQLYKYNKNNIK